MPNENKDSVTFERLKQYLKSAGFNRSLAMENTIAFHHEESGVIVTLTVPEDGTTVRDADLMSILIRLENNGIETEDRIRQLRHGQIPFAA